MAEVWRGGVYVELNIHMSEFVPFLCLSHNVHPFSSETLVSAV